MIASMEAEDVPNQAVRPAGYFGWNRAVNVVLAVLLLPVATPIIALLVILIRCTSRGPAVYRQTRVGRNGELFTLYKLRTMRLDAEVESGAVWSVGDDPRVTRTGRILRKLHLDELPQLFNVLRGDMALVGPRPERPEFTDRLEKAVPRYVERLRVLPGLTGLAQLNLPADSDLDSVRRKVAVDLIYVRGGGLWMDLRILLCTAAKVFHLPLESLRRVLRLECRPTIPRPLRLEPGLARVIRQAPSMTGAFPRM
ncbi:MAG: sugar transferase [Planctomycetales bacterium]